MVLRSPALLTIFVVSCIGTPLMACEPILQSPVRTEVIIDPFEGTETATEETVDIENRGDTVCELQAQFLAEDGTPVPFRIGENLYSVILQPDGDASQFEQTAEGVFRFRLDASGTARMRFTVRPQSVSERGAGELSSSILFELSDLDSDTIFDLRNIEVAEIVPARVRAKVALSQTGGGSESLTLDFPNLQEGQNERFYLQTTSTVPVTLTFVSSNNGMLIAEDGTARGFEIPYGLTIDGIKTNLDQVTTLFQPFTTQGKVYRGEVIIGSVDNAGAGLYRDEIVVIIEAE